MPLPPADAVERRALTIDETAASVTVSRSTVVRLIASGRLRHTRIGSRVLIPVDAIDELLSERGQ